MTARRLQDDCFLHDKDRLRHDEALAILESRMATITGTEPLQLTNAGGRILAKAVTAPRPIPAFDNAAVDGYAFRGSDYESTGGYMPVVTRVAAGDEEEIELPQNAAARIFTGARMPHGADTVAMQEDCEPHEQDGSFVAIPPGLKPGANCRLAGEDVAKGAAVVDPGTWLRPQDLAAIASTGTEEINVFEKLKVSLFSSGNELLQPGDSYRQGAVYDANSPMISSMLSKMPVEIVRKVDLLDEKQAAIDGLDAAAKSSDAVISSGGASKGEEDHLITALEEMGTCHLWQLAIKPGRPMGFGQVSGKPVFVLPGNPVAAFVCFLLYVRPCLTVLAGGRGQTPQRYPLPADFEIKKKKPDRREFLRGMIATNGNGETTVSKFERDGSGLISGIQRANCLIEIEEQSTTVTRGQSVNVIPFAELGI